MKRLPAICAAGALVGGVLLFSQTIPEPRKKFGASITGAFEGWFTSDRDSRTFLVGYFNRNTEQEQSKTPTREGLREHDLGPHPRWCFWLAQPFSVRAKFFSTAKSLRRKTLSVRQVTLGLIQLFLGRTDIQIPPVARRGLLGKGAAISPNGGA